MDYSSLSLSEAEACFVLSEKFSQHGLHIAENMPFSQDQVVFNPDGYDVEKRIGYEYRSCYYDYFGEEIGCESELSIPELAQIEEWNEQNGPYFLILDESSYRFTYEEEREAYLQQLEADIDRYLAYLIWQGVL